MPLKRQNYAAFFSYLQLLDQQDNGRLTLMRERLEREVQIHTGEAFTIFQDRDDLEWGQAWHERIQGAIDGSTYLIAVISPGYLKSRLCRKEFNLFLQREKKLGRSELILPIIYIDTPGLADEHDPVAVEINKRQWVRWTDLRHENWNAPAVGRRLELLAKQIRDSIQRNAVSARERARETTLAEAMKLKHLPSSLPVPGPEPTRDEDFITRLITVSVHPTGDFEVDRRRVKNIYNVLVSHPGKDRFQFQIFENGKGNLVDFPDASTNISSEMLERLKKLIGSEEWRIEDVIWISNS